MPENVCYLTHWEVALTIFSFLTNSTDLNSNPDSGTFTKLHSLDQLVNRYGRSLVNLYISNKLSILNGRVKGDLLGKFTCYKPNGASVGDRLCNPQ